MGLHDRLNRELAPSLAPLGAVVVEEIFAVPGLGRMLLTAITQRDYALVQGAVLVVAVVFVAVNTLVDVLYGWLDPRIRYQ